MVLGTILLVLLASLCLFFVGAWKIFGENVTAAKSVTKLEDGLYYMEYAGDYGFDEFLENGGATSEAELAEYITYFLSGGFVKTASAPAEQNYACSTLTVDSLMGRNFEWQGENGKAMIIHTIPENGYESYSTCWLDFLGFGENWLPEGLENQYMALAAIYVPLDGMNEKGLCVADLVNGDEEQTHQNTGKAGMTTNSAIRLLLDKAATVDEAIALLAQYDMNSAVGLSHHLSISDASGKAVVVEYVDNQMIVTETAVVTNHYLSEEKYGVGNEESKMRFDKLMSKRTEIADTAQMQDAMASVSYQGITQWSIVYDKENTTFDFYWQMNFDKPYTYAITK